MSPHASDPPSADASPFSGFLQEFIDSRGYSRSQIANAMEKVVPAYLGDYPAQKGQLVPISESTLSRWCNGIPKKPGQRPKFNAVVLTVLHLDWQASGAGGAAPGLQDVARIWGEWQSWRQPPLNSSADESPASRDADTPAGGPSVGQVDLSDAEQVRFNNAYGSPGVALLQAARTSEAGAALDLGLLRTLDGHHAEGDSWLQAARASGSQEATELLCTGAPGQRKTDATRYALQRATLLNGSTAHYSRKILLLERAAHAGSRKAARMLAAHYDRVGHAGPAARWRIAADSDK